MHSAVLGNMSLDWSIVSDLINIVIINLILAGDNAVVIAMAVRSLPKAQRTKGLIYGSAAAVLLRIFITFFVAQVLSLGYIKLAGGLVILWIAVKLFGEDEQSAEDHGEVASFWFAIRLIVVADITMSLDNVLAVGAASHGNFYLLLFGLGLSIPLVVFASSLLSQLMDRFPIIIYIGAAILGKVGGEMIMTDPIAVKYVNPGTVAIYTVEVILMVAVVAVGYLRARRKKREAAALQSNDTQGCAEHVSHDDIPAGGQRLN